MSANRNNRKQPRSIIQDRLQIRLGSLASKLTMATNYKWPAGVSFSEYHVNTKKNWKQSRFQDVAEGLCVTDKTTKNS
jgi:hypothetical protein